MAPPPRPGRGDPARRVGPRRRAPSRSGPSRRGRPPPRPTFQSIVPARMAAIKVQVDPGPSMRARFLPERGRVRDPQNPQKGSGAPRAGLLRVLRVARVGPFGSTFSREREATELYPVAVEIVPVAGA